MKKIFGEKDRSYRGFSGFIAALLLATYTWSGFLWAPEVLRTAIEARALEVFHREISIGEIRFNPFTLTAHLHDVKLPGSKGAPVLSVAKVKADVELASLWRGGAVVSKMMLSEPRLRAVIGPNGSLDLSELIAPKDKNKSAAQTVLPPLWIENLTLTKATIDVIDRRGGRNAKLQLSPLDLSFHDFRTEAGHATAYDLALHTTRSGQLKASGKLTLQPLTLTGSLTAQALEASTVDRFLGRVLPMRLTAGTFDFTGSYQLAFKPQLRWKLEVPQVIARAVTVNERNTESTAPLQTSQLTLQGLALEWPARTFRLDQLAMVQARFHVVRDAGGSFNVARWLQRSGGARTEQGSVEGAASPWALAIKRVDLQQTYIAVDDELATANAHFELTPTHIVLNDVSNAAGARASVRIATQLDRRGRINLAGEIGVAPLLVSLEVEAIELPLAMFQPYVDEIATLALAEGKLDFTGKVTHSPEGKMAGWRFAGRARLAALRAQQEGRELLALHTMTADGIDWRAQRFRIERIVAQRPSARVSLDKQGRLNLTRVWRSNVPSRTAISTERAVDPLLRLALETAGEAVSVPSAGVKRSRVPVQIARIEVVDGSAEVTDASIAPVFTAALTAVKGSLIGVSSDPGARAKLRLDARVDAQAPLSVAGEMNLHTPTRFTELTLRCRDLPVTKLDAYAAKFAGHHFAKGKLALEATYRLAEGKANAEHHVVLEGFVLGAAIAQPKSGSVPAALAVSLLKDREGRITLDLPVSGRLDEPTFSAPIAAWQAFAQVIDTASTAPFKALGSATGGSEELAYVDFAPGSAEIPAAEQAKIDRLASALKERPEVRLEIPFAVALQDDAIAVARARLATRVPQMTQDIAAFDDRGKKQLIRLLEQQHAKDVGQPAPAADTADGSPELDTRIAQLARLLLDAYAPSPTQLRGLGRARAQALESALVTPAGLQSGRVIVVGDRQPQVTAGRVRLSLGLGVATVPGP